jgi:hypothetical protein
MTKSKKWMELRVDFAAYERGLLPTAAEMTAAPGLDQWWVVVQQIGQVYVARCCGEARNHPEAPDSQRIRTPAVQWWDRHDRWLRCPNRLFVLGEGVGDAIPIDGVEL